MRGRLSQTAQVRGRVCRCGYSRFHEEPGLERRNLYPILALKLMTVRTRPHRLRTRPRSGRRAARREASVEPGLVQPTAPQARERAAGGPQDLAAYCCSCGYVFEAAVSTTVGCPQCGGTQAW
jgi:hypothetical protein